MAYVKRILPFLLTLAFGVTVGNLFAQTEHRRECQMRQGETYGGVYTDGSVFTTDSHFVSSRQRVTTTAVLLSKPAPGYTDEARRRRIEGEVMLRVVLSSTGRVARVVPLKTLDGGLTEQAIAAAEQIEFIPAKKDGQPVSQLATIAYDFRLD